MSDVEVLGWTEKINSDKSVKRIWMIYMRKKEDCHHLWREILTTLLAIENLTDVGWDLDGIVGQLMELKALLRDIVFSLSRNVCEMWEGIKMCWVDVW